MRLLHRPHLRILTQLAIRPEQLTTIAKIYVETARGRKGGVWLLKRSAEINIGEIVRRMEPDFYLVRRCC